MSSAIRFDVSFAHVGAWLAKLLRSAVVLVCTGVLLVGDHVPCASVRELTKGIWSEEVNRVLLVSVGCEKVMFLVCRQWSILAEISGFAFDVHVGKVSAALTWRSVFLSMFWRRKLLRCVSLWCRVALKSPCMSVGMGVLSLDVCEDHLTILSSKAVYASRRCVGELP